jgi:uncharacterized membrane protein YcaP (DUF421 family)
MALDAWDGWARVWALAVVLVVAYAWVVVVLRVSGNRTLAKLNAFDFVVTIALGSTLSSVILSRSVPLVEGLLALGGLVLLQFVVAWSSSRSGAVDRAVKSDPTAVVVAGRLRHDALLRCRVSEDEVAAAIRKHGSGTLDDVQYVVLETDGTFSVLTGATDDWTLAGVDGAGATGDR